MTKCQNDHFVCIKICYYKEGNYLCDQLTTDLQRRNEHSRIDNGKDIERIGNSEISEPKHSTQFHALHWGICHSSNGNEERKEQRNLQEQEKVAVNLCNELTCN